MKRLPLVLLVAALCVPTMVRAHGGFPLPTGTLLNAQGGDPLVTTTFGLLLPLPLEPGFRWVCEEAVGGNLTNAVLWTRTTGGTVLVGGRVGLFRLTQNRCGLARPGGVTGMDRVRSVTASPDGPVAAVGVGQGEVRVSVDDGVTFAPTALSITNAWPSSMLLDGDANAYRLLVLWRFLADGHAELQLSTQGQDAPRVRLADSSAGVWELAGWDSARPGFVYVRENGDTADRILRVNTVDGAFTVLRAAEDDLFVAVHPDGQRVAHGGLRSPLQVSINGGDTFEERATLRQVRSLRWGGDRLFASADNWNDGFAAGFSDDNGLSWTGLGRFVDIVGVSNCPDAGAGCPVASDMCTHGEGNDVLTECAQYWPALVSLFGIHPDGGPPPQTPDAGSTVEPPPTQGCPNCSAAGAPGALAVLLLLLRRRRG